MSRLASSASVLDIAGIAGASNDAEGVVSVAGITVLSSALGVAAGMDGADISLAAGASGSLAGIVGIAAGSLGAAAALSAAAVSVAAGITGSSAGAAVSAGGSLATIGWLLSAAVGVGVGEDASIGEPSLIGVLPLLSVTSLAAGVAAGVAASSFFLKASNSPKVIISFYVVANDFMILLMLRLCTFYGVMHVISGGMVD